MLDTSEIRTKKRFDIDAFLLPFLALLEACIFVLDSFPLPSRVSCAVASFPQSSPGVLYQMYIRLPKDILCVVCFVSEFGLGPIGLLVLLALLGPGRYQ